ncbi:MAG: hypothetical protein RIQ60_1955 [Pseudomonadota bacterium]|jgi:hypothetical protein
MPDWMQWLAGLLLSGCVVSTSVFLVLAERSTDPESMKALTRPKTWHMKVFMTAVLVGWLTVIACGVHTVLSVVPIHWGDLAGIVSVMTALGSLVVLDHFEKLPQLRADHELLSATSAWEWKELTRTGRCTEARLQQLLAERQSEGKTPFEQQVAASNHVFASELKKREDRVESALLRQIEAAREQERVEAQKAADAEAKRAKAAAEAAAKAEKEAAELRRAESILSQCVRPLPALTDLDSLQGEAVLDLAKTQAAWQSFKSLVSDARTTLPDNTYRGLDRLVSGIKELSGVTLPTGMRLGIACSGTARDGFCDAVVHDIAGARPLYMHLEYEESTVGLTYAFFFAAALQRQWSWGHGFYDRDHMLIGEARTLANVVADAGAIPEQAAASWPPPGIRLKRVDGGFEVACLSFRPGSNIYDLSITVQNGRSSELRVRQVLNTGKGVLY